jgi:hypothetical protein
VKLGKIKPLEFAFAKAPINTESPTRVRAALTFRHSSSLLTLASENCGGTSAIFSVAKEYTPMLALPKMPNRVIAKSVSFS